MTATKPSGGGSLVSPETRTRVKKLGEPIALFFGRLGLTPNGLTLIGFGITVFGAILVGFQAWLVGGIVVLLGGVFDMFDGTLARATGKVSSVGAFMDSVFDRWGEGITYVGIVVGCVNAGFGLGAGLAAFAMASAFLVSYTRAKSEGLGFSTGGGMAEVGLAPREIRLVILSVGLVVAGLTGGVGPNLTGGSLGVALALGAIGILATITIIQRIIHVRQQAVASDGK